MKLLVMFKLLKVWLSSLMEAWFYDTSGRGECALLKLAFGTLVPIIYKGL